MPLVPFAAAVIAPKAGAAMATAFALGTDDFHAHDFNDHAVALQQHATAFIRLPISKTKLWNMIVGPEVAAYHWVHDKSLLLWGKVFGAAEAASDQGRMVEYYASGCQHCKHMEPIWKDANGLWDKQDGAEAHKVVWEQKQCLDDNWKPGADFKECMDNHIQRFPNIKFFAPGSKTGEDFFLDRSPEQLVDFAKTGINPSPDVMPRAPDDEADMKLVDFYAAACPHCKTLEPVWDDAHKQWDKAIGQPEGEPPRDDLPLISFEKKQCYDDHWQAGPDNAECQKYHVDAFPTIKLFKPDPHGHGFVGTDYTGPRTADGIANFLKQETHVEDYLKQLNAEKAAMATADGAHHDAQVGDAAYLGTEADGAHHDAQVGVQIPDDIRAKVEEMAAAQHASPQMAAHAGGDKEIQILQGSTPPMEDKAAQEPVAALQAIKTAMMPLPVLACLPVRRSRTAPSSPQRVITQAPPRAAAQFI